MSATETQNLASALAAATDWWREAGVDCAFVDEPQSWLQAKEVEAAVNPEPRRATDVLVKAPEPVRPSIGGAASEWPGDLPAFQEWWMTQDTLAPPGALRVRPSGPVGAELLLAVAHPEQADGDTLLSGPLGRFLRSFTKAAGLDETSLYFASLLPACTPHEDSAELAQAGIADIFAHHVSLVKPKRLLVFGADALSLMQHDPAQGPAEVREYAIQSGTVPMLCAWGPDRLGQRARARKAFWNTWLQWTAHAD
ncbi:hypothetical protein ACXYN8_06710 [Altererythrobacter sp. CAU 1778]